MCVCIRTYSCVREFAHVFKLMILHLHSLSLKYSFSLTRTCLFLFCKLFFYSQYYDNSDEGDSYHNSNDIILSLNHAYPFLFAYKNPSFYFEPGIAAEI